MLKWLVPKWYTSFAEFIVSLVHFIYDIKCSVDWYFKYALKFCTMCTCIEELRYPVILLLCFCTNLL